MATDFQVRHYQGLATQADRLKAAHADIRAAQRQQIERVSTLTWSDIAAAIRVLGMPQASEDFAAVMRALRAVVEREGYDNAEELLQSLDIAAECAEELRLPDLPSEREQADADARDRAERAYEERRDECSVS
ncbi:MAG: hypothetical protein RJA36_1659 [Pseudomonadota bacterium]|jgi:hypothetical protein